jgi:hypothetical protein
MAFRKRVAGAGEERFAREWEAFPPTSEDCCR